MTMCNMGQRILLSVMREQKINQIDIARRFGVSRQSVYLWMTGLGVPSHERREQIDRAFGIDSSSWFETDRSGYPGATERLVLTVDVRLMRGIDAYRRSLLTRPTATIISRPDLIRALLAKGLEALSASST